tara:strand:- start:810 stop:1517 length:708 start_codon:yes stop_codon:yes gene_type:complete
MRALILASGFGTRLYPITKTIPKCLVEINGRPLLDYWLEKLVNAGIYKILINTHWLANKVEDYIYNSKWAKYVDLVYEEKLLGTGGTLLNNINFFRNNEVLVLHADNFSKFNLKDFIDNHKSRPEGCKITLLSFQTDTPSSCGIIKTNINNIITEFHEKVDKPPGNLANGAVYLFQKGFVEELEKKRSHIREITTDIFPNYIGKIFNVTTNLYHRDIGTLKSFVQCQKDFKSMEN